MWGRRVTERLLDRVSELSPARLALLSLRLGHRPAAVTRDQAIAPVAHEPEPRIDELSDEEVEALLERTLCEQASEGDVESEPPVTIQASERRPPADLLENLGELSDEEVESLLDELMRSDAG